MWPFKAMEQTKQSAYSLPVKDTTVPSLKKKGTCSNHHQGYKITMTKYPQSTIYLKGQTYYPRLILITCPKGNHKKTQIKPVPQFMKCGFSWVPVASSLRHEDPQEVCLTIRSLSSNVLEPKVFTLVAQTCFPLCWGVRLLTRLAPDEPKELKTLRLNHWK